MWRSPFEGYLAAEEILALAPCDILAPMFVHHAQDFFNKLKSAPVHTHARLFMTGCPTETSNGTILIFKLIFDFEF